MLKLLWKIKTYRPVPVWIKNSDFILMRKNFVFKF